MATVAAGPHAYAPPGGTGVPSVAELEWLITRLAEVEASATSSPSDTGRIERISVLERLKSAAAAAQARHTAAFDASQRREQAAQGVPADERGAGVAGQVALARQDSRHRGGRHLGLAKTLTANMPHTLAALASGVISEWRAVLIVRETSCLRPEDQARVDAQLRGRLAGLGDRRIQALARELAYAADKEASLARTRRAPAQRRVTLRPAPDTMSHLTGLLPVADGVAVHAALAEHAKRLRSGGDPRSRGQIMADELVERITGRSATSAPRPADAQDRTDGDQADPDRSWQTRWTGQSHPTSQPTAADSQAGNSAPASRRGPDIEICLVMTDRALLGGADDPVHLLGHGPIPAHAARDLIRGTTGSDPEEDAQVWVRRLYTDADDGRLVAMESRRRSFPAQLRRFVVLRDQVCRTPWCDAPIRHIDHVTPASEDGATSETNSQGLCEACNYTKQAPGWRASPDPTRGAGDIVTVSTPTGHRYHSRPPDPVGTASAAARGRPEPAPSSVLKRRLAALLNAA